MNHKVQSILQNPKDLYYHTHYPFQQQVAPGIQEKMDPLPDCGEEIYIGHERLIGRKALITGGDSGIGRAVAIAFSREGADIAINYLPEEKEDAESLLELLKDEGRKISLVPGDLSDELACKAIVDKSFRELEGLDILVLNAGVQTALNNIEELTGDQLRHTFAVNVFSQFFMVKAALPHLPPGSSVIMTGSSDCHNPDEKRLDYASSKYAVVGFSRALAKQLAGRGIRVNTVCPGPVWTPLKVSGGLLVSDIPSHGRDTLIERAAQPVEIAGAYVYLASNESSFVTAAVYGVAGGLF